MADVLSFNDNDAGAEEDEVAVNIDGSKRVDFAMGLLSIRRDNAAMMMYAPLPLPAHRPPPHYREKWAQRTRRCPLPPRTNSALFLTPCPVKRHGRRCLVAEVVTTLMRMLENK